MQNIEHIRALTAEEMADWLSFHCRFHCGDCPAVGEFYRGGHDLCPAFEEAIEKQKKKTGGALVTETYGFINPDSCRENMEKWLTAEGDSSRWRLSEHMEKEAGE